MSIAIVMSIAMWPQSVAALAGGMGAPTTSTATAINTASRRGS